MRVECNIDSEYDDPYVVFYINKMTPAIMEIISLLEKENTSSNKMIAIKDEKTYFLEQDAIEIIRTEEKEIVCYDKLKNRYILDKPLYELEKKLGQSFARISKSSIINIGRVSHVSASFNGTMEIVMKNGVEDYISRNFRKSFKERLGLK